MEIREDLNDSCGMAETIFHFGLIKEYYDRSEDQAMELYRKGYSLAESGEYKIELSYLARHIGGIFLAEAELDSAENYLTLSLNLRIEAGLKLFIAPALTALAEVMRQKQNFEKASAFLLEAIQYANQTNAYRFHVSALLSLGDLELELENRVVALEHYKEALRVAEASGYMGGEEAAKEILPGITLTPTTSELMGTFVKYPPNDKEPLLIGMPELSASFATGKGEVLITGCLHSSVEEIVKKSAELLNMKIYLVCCGFHLIPYDRSYIENLANRMQQKVRN